MADSKSNLQSELRCHHCAGPLSKETETSEWTVPPLIRDSFSMIGSAVGGTASAFYGFNHGSIEFYLGVADLLTVACLSALNVQLIDLIHIYIVVLFLARGVVMPVVRKCIKGPMWLHFFIGAPPVIVFSSACAGLAGGAIPALAQLASSSYHAAVSSSSLQTPPQDKKMHSSRTSSTL